MKNGYIDHYRYSGDVILFDRRGVFSFPTCGFGCHVIIFGADMSSPVHADNKIKIYFNTW